MSNISIQWAVVANQSEKINSCKKKLEVVSAKLRNIKGTGVFSAGNMFLYRGKIQGVIDEVQNHCADMTILQMSMDRIIQKYRETEQKLSGLGEDTSANSDSQSGGKLSNLIPEWKDVLKNMAMTGLFGPVGATVSAINSVARWNEIVNPNWGKLGWNFLGKCGVIGSGIKNIGDIVTGKWDDNLLKNFSKFGVDMVGKGAAVVKSASPKWLDYLWGIKGGKQQTLTDWFESNYLGKVLNPDEFSDAKSLKNAKVAGKVGAVAKWAGHALSAWDAYDYVKDKGYTVDEALVGGATHFAVDVGIGVGIAALGATVGAPALAVGAATVGVKWIADETVQYLTGDEDATFIGCVSDKATELYKGAKKSVGKAYKNAKNTIKNAWADFTANPIWSW